MDKKIRTLEANQQETVLKISQAVSRTLDLKEILEMACQMTAQALKADRCSIGLIYNKDIYRIVHAYRKKRSYPSIAGSEFKLTDFPNVAPAILKRKVAHLFVQKKNHLSKKERAIFKRLDVKVYLSVPIVAGRKVLGAIHPSKVEDSSPYSSSDINLCQTIANQVGVAINNANLVKDLKDRYEQQNLILGISKSLFQTFDLKVLLRKIVQNTCEALKMDRVAVTLYDEVKGKGVTTAIHCQKGTSTSRASKEDLKSVKLRYSKNDSPEIYKSILTKKFFASEDMSYVRMSPRLRKYISQTGIKSTLIIPLFSRRETIGTINLHTLKDRHLFTDSEIKLCQTIANLASLAIENAKLVKDLQDNNIKIEQQTKSLEKQNKEQSILLDISKALSRTLDLNELFEITTKKTADLLGMDRCGIVLVDEVKGAAFFVSIYAMGRHQPPEESIRGSIEDFPAIFSHLRSKHKFHTVDISKSDLSSKEKKMFKEKGTKSLLVVPLTPAGRFQGLLALSTVKKQHPFTESEIKLCQAIANQLSVVIENARLVQDLQEKSDKIKQQAAHLEKQFREERILLEISKALSQTLDTKTLFTIVTKKTVELLSIDRCAAMLIDEIQGKLIRHTSFYKGNHQHELPRHWSSVDNFPSIMNYLKRKKIFFLPDLPKSVLSAREKLYFRKLGVKSMLSIPFVLKNRVLGILALSSIGKRRQFTESEIKLCQAIANQLSVVIENARLMLEVKQKSEKIVQQTNALEKQYNEQRILLEISKALSQTLDLKKLFKIVTRKTAEFLEIERCVAALIDESNREIYLYTAFSRGKHENDLQMPHRKLEDFPMMVKQVEDKHIFFTSDISHSNVSSKEKTYFKKLGVKSVLNIPFVLKNEILGILGLNALTKQHKFTDSEIKLCQAIANQLSVAIENARLVQEVKNKSIKIEEQSDILEKQFREQSILLEISKALAKTLDLAKLFRTVTKKTADLLRTERCAVILLDEVKETINFHKVYSEGKHRIEYEGLSSEFKDFPILVAELKKEQIFYTSNVSGSILSSAEKKVFEKERIKSLLMIPFFYANKVKGLLALSSLKKQRRFRKSEIKLCQAIVNQLSVAVENARLMELTKKHSSELENLSLKIIDTQEKEKKNIAEKLHDVITQDLTAIQLNLKMCQQILPEPDEQIKAKLKESEELASQSLENLRNLTSDLRPPVLDHFGLASAIHWYVDSFRRRTNIKIDLKISELNYKLSPEFETTIYRIIQESLTNVAKHSRANQVSISFYQKGNKSRIQIKDNGIGFDSYNKPSFAHGFGLFRLKENAELLGGKFKIISKIGRGTKLDITLPCKEVKKA